jgi:queuosine precursor transporter
MSTLARYKSTLLYVALIVAVNYGFTVAPLVKLPDGTLWPPMSLVVGFIFVVRDFAQREIGHKILFAMLVGAALSYVMAAPFVAIASAAAFLVSELMDWLIYSVTKRPLSSRILYSSLLATPVDSAVFLYGLGAFSIVGVITMTVSKLIGALIVWWLIRRRETQSISSAAI